MLLASDLYPDQLAFWDINFYGFMAGQTVGDSNQNTAAVPPPVTSEHLVVAGPTRNGSVKR